MTDYNPHDEGMSPAPAPEVRSALVQGVARYRRRTRARALGAGVAVAMVSAAALVGGLLPQNPSPALAAALAIEPDGNGSRFEIVKSDAGEQQMTTELHDAGIDAEVQIIPTIPSRVGDWMGLQRVGAPPENTRSRRWSPAAEIWERDDIAADGRVLMIRRSALGRLDNARSVFYMGREPGDGETPQVLFGTGPREVGPDWRNHVGSPSQIP